MTGPADANDHELARRLQDGDAGALQDLVERHKGEMRQRVERLLPPSVRRRVSASDVIQESLLVAFERRADFEHRGDGALKRWFLGIAEKKALRAVQWHLKVEKRSSRREVTRNARAQTSEFRDRNASTPSQAAERVESADLVREALGALPEHYREIIRLVNEEQLTLREAAARVDRSREAAKKLYGRAITEFGRRFRELARDDRD